MGELINLNPPKAITDADIPAAIARDSETTAAINAHEAAVDPHSQYLLPSEGDTRYRRQGITQFFEGGVRFQAPYINCQSSRTMASAWYGVNDVSNRVSFGFEVQSFPWADAAYIAFNRPSYIIAFLGLDSDNHLKWGGGSFPSVQKIWHEGFGTPVWQTPSDKRLKQDIRPIPSALALILECKPVSFQYNNVIRSKKNLFVDSFQRDKIHYGFVANDFPIQDLVAERSEGYLGLDYVEIIPFLCRAIQELHIELQAVIFNQI